MKWQVDLASDIGGRTEQQDRAEVFAVPNRSNECLVVLADGMGGQQDGGLAAQAVLDTAKDVLAQAAPDNPRHFLTDLCAAAHRAIKQIGSARNSKPASTCVLLYIKHDEAYWAHVGDSRLYHFNADSLLSQTRDHTVGELLKNEPSEEVAAPDLEQADSRLYMCLGGENDLQPEYGATAIGTDDWFMLCSDGFWNQIDAEEVSERLLAAPPGERLAAELATAATRRGGAGSDNVSIALVTRKASRLAGAWRRVLGSRRSINR